MSEKIYICNLCEKGYKTPQSLCNHKKLKHKTEILDDRKMTTLYPENNHNMNVDDLYIKQINVGRAFALKRFAARGRGKSSRILKTFSNICIILAEREMCSAKKQYTKTKEKEMEYTNGSKS